MSPREIVRQQYLPDIDGWELALVQRDTVWDENRMRQLLDSLLRGYPIGSLLLCRVQNHVTEARPLGSSQADVRIVEATTPQLVDGQQRANALYSIFSGQGHGRFFLRLVGDWSADTSHIAWRPRLESGPDENHPSMAADEGDPDPTRYLDLAVWCRVMIDGVPALTDESLDDVVDQLSGSLVLPTDPDARADVLAKLARLRDAWLDQRIPVITADVEGPQDILELFTRVNRGGIEVSGRDLYFAAVKTFWHDRRVDPSGTLSAHAALSAIVTSSANLIGTWTALSLVSRLALAGLGDSDIVPLDIKRLATGDKEYTLKAMKVVAAVLPSAVGDFIGDLRQSSELKQGLRFVHHELWEEVLAWATLSHASGSSWSAQDIRAVESYLLGGTLFSWPGVLGDPYRRDAFQVAITAGAQGDPFPLDGLLAVARDRGEDLRRGRRSVVSSKDVTQIGRAYPRLIIAVAQGLDDDTSGLDWDHIIPAATRGRLRLPHGSGRRFRIEADHLNDWGNFWQIDFSANRALQALPPRVKFSMLTEWAGQPQGRVSAELFSGMLPDHRAAFEAAGDLIGGELEPLARAIQATINARGEWLVAHVLDNDRFPRIRDFGSDAAVPPTPAPPKSPKVTDRLGLDSLKAERDDQSREARRRNTAIGNNPNLLLNVSEGEWHDHGWMLASVHRELTKKHAKLTGRGIGNQIWKDVEHSRIVRHVPLRSPSGSEFVLTLSGQAIRQGRSPFVFEIPRATPGFALIAERLTDAATDGTYRVERAAGRLEIFIPVDHTANETTLTRQVDGWLLKLRAIIEEEADPDPPRLEA